MKACEVMTFSMIMTSVYVVVRDLTAVFLGRLERATDPASQPARELPANIWECHFTKGGRRRWSKKNA